jgi:hypothetical protein
MRVSVVASRNYTSSYMYGLHDSLHVNDMPLDGTQDYSISLTVTMT